MTVPQDVLEMMSKGERFWFEIRKQKSLREYWDKKMGIKPITSKLLTRFTKG